jgi:AraC-like DNA-binding protein
MELADIPLSQSPLPASCNSIRTAKQHARIGQLKAESLLLPNMIVLNMNWQTKEELMIVENETVTDYVSINFQLQGHVISNFRGLRSLPMQDRTHNLLFSQPEKHTHLIQRNQQISALNLHIDKKYFTQLIGTEDAWAEGMVTKLEKGQAFLAVDGSAAITPPMLSLIHTIQNNPRTGAIRNLQVQSAIFELLALQLDQCRLNHITDIPLKKNDVEKLQFVHLYIAAHFLEDLTLAQLARISMLNEFKLKKGFKSLFDTTVFGYIRRLRMQHATRLLKDEKKSIEEVAWELGYEHAQHFSVSFKKHFGISPSQLR